MTRSAALITAIATAYQSAISDVTPDPLPVFPTGFTLLPYLTVQMLIGTEYENLQGQSGLSKTQFQVNVWHGNKETAESTRDSVRDFLLTLAPAVLSGKNVEATNHVVDSEFYDGIRELHKLITRVWIWWSV